VCTVQGKDLFMFNSGDIVDGTGLAGATPIDGQALLPIIRQVRARENMLRHIMALISRSISRSL
jgi:hypothetical protein